MIWTSIRQRKNSEETSQEKRQGWATERLDCIEEQDSGLFTDLKRQFWIGSWMVGLSGIRIAIVCQQRVLLRSIGRMNFWADGQGRWARLFLFVPHRTEFALFILQSNSIRSTYSFLCLIGSSLNWFTESRVSKGADNNSTLEKSCCVWKFDDLWMFDRFWEAGSCYVLIRVIFKFFF